MSRPLECPARRRGGTGARPRARDRPEEGRPVSQVAIVTDSASDYDPARARQLGIAIVPLIVNFGAETFEAGLDLSAQDFWQKMTAPGAPFPTTAATSPGVFRATYERLFDEGADAIV